MRSHFSAKTANMSSCFAVSPLILSTPLLVHPIAHLTIAAHGERIKLPLPSHFVVTLWQYNVFVLFVLELGESALNAQIERAAYELMKRSLAFNDPVRVAAQFAGSENELALYLARLFRNAVDCHD